MKTLSATAIAQKALSYNQAVFLVELDADAPDVGASTQYIASREYTLEGQLYSDKLTPLGLSLGWQRVRPGGGLASVSGAKVSLLNEEQETTAAEDFFLENDEVRLYLVFVTGTEVDADKVELARLVVEDYPSDIKEWTWDLIDGSDQKFREIPAARINQIDYPDAPLDAISKVLPVTFGTLNVGPFDGAGAYPQLAPCRCLDVFQRQYTAGLQCDSYGAVYQYYPDARRLAEVLAITQTGSTFTVDDGTRMMIVSPVSAKATNDVAGWKAIADGDLTSSVAIVNLDNLDVWFGGVPKIGDLTAITIEIKAAGGYDYTVKSGTDTKIAKTSDTNDTTITLTAADWATDWDFERLNIEIDGTGAATIEEVYLDLRYDDQQTADRQSLPLHQKVVGWEDVTGNYRDGAVISSVGDPLTNPAHQIAAVFRGKALLNRLTAEVDSDSVDAAATARTGWAFAFIMDKGMPDPASWLNEFCVQAGMHLFVSFEGTFKVVVMDKTRVPAHTFLADTHIAVKNPQDNPRAWEYDYSHSRTPTRDVINEIVLRYSLDRTTGEYTGLRIASGHYRVSGTCATSKANSTLIDAAATFQTDGVKVGDTAYVYGDQDYTVDVIDSEIQLTISCAGDVTDNAAGTAYFVGPDLDGRLVRSQLRYKTENPLGSPRSDVQSEGGYTSDFIADSTTAAAWVEHLIEWRSQRRLLIEFATFLNALDVELGDAAWYDDDWLPTNKRPVAVSLTSGAHNSSTTTITVSAGTAGHFRPADYILADTEVMVIVAVDTGAAELTVTRGQCNTTAAAHVTATVLYLLNRTKWEITGIKPPDMARGVPKANQIRLEIQEMPPSYLPTGRVVEEGYPTASSATQTQLVQSGWVTRPSGLIWEEDEFSNISYVGPAV